MGSEAEHGLRRKQSETCEKTEQQADIVCLLRHGTGQLIIKERGEKTKVTIAFRSTSAPATVVQSPDFKQYIKPFLSDRVDFTFMQNYDNWGGAIRATDLRGIMQLRRIPRVKKHMCLRTLDLSVLYDGSVRLCGCRCKETEFDDLVVGNIQQDSLKNLYWGPKAQAIRDSFINNQLREACKDCSLYMPSWMLK